METNYQKCAASTLTEPLLVLLFCVVMLFMRTISKKFTNQTVTVN